MLKVIVAILLSGGAAWAQGKTVYVSPDGSNEKTGASAAEAVKAIWKGIDIAGDGGTVKIAEGEYKGRADSGVLEVKAAVTLLGGFSKDFASRQPFVTQTRLIGSLEGKTPLRADAEDGRSIVLDGLVVNGESVNDYSKGYLGFREAQAPLILVKAIGKGTSVKVLNCLAMNSANSGIHVEANVGSITIDNCVVLAARPSSIHISSNNRGPVDIQNCTLLVPWRNDPKGAFPYCNGNAVNIEGRTGTITIKSNLMGQAPECAVRNVDGANKTLRLLNNTIVNCPKGLYVTMVEKKHFVPKADEMGDADLLECSGNKTIEHDFGAAKTFVTKSEKLAAPLMTVEEAAPFLPSDKMPKGVGAQPVKTGT